MSVLDQLRALEQQVQRRLRELGPLVAEYRDLEKVAERLGLKRAEDEAAETAAAKSAPRAKGKATSSRARTPKSKPRPAKRAARPRGSTAATTPKPRASAATEPRRTAEPKPATAAEPKPVAEPKPAPAGGLAAAAKPSARKRAAAAPGQRQQ